MSEIRAAATKIGRDNRGAIAVEFALLCPFLLLILFGAMTYGAYFWMAHAVQQVANDGARVAVGGLNAAERRSLALASLNEALPHYAYLDPTRAVLDIDSSGDRFVVSIAYDASDSPIFVFRKLVPLPSSTIRRQAVVSLGGY
jgi:Flp pilus assembly protein TadG